MTPEQFKRVREIFEQALEIDPAALRAWLDVHAGDDPQVRQEAGALLQINSRAGSFLAEPVVQRHSDLLADDGALEPGTTIGTYTIERELGRGGMGHVYLARDSRLGRTVAVKALPPMFGSDPAQRERLRREAKAAGGLQHPGICTIYALEELDGNLFIVSEYIEGQTLRQEIGGNRRPSITEIRDTARELAAALASAHAKGITHRDLKPENVMRNTEGHLKILDFGLARFERAVDETAPQVTQPGTLIGTPAYMAPEQLNGELADARTDVFAFGVLIYEYACGVHPFEAANALGVAGRILHGEPSPISERRPDLRLPITTVIAKSLRKSPAERYASAAEIVSALARDDGPGTITLVTAWWRRHQMIVIGLYLLASAVGWQIKEWRHGVTDPIFLLIGVAATAGAIFRGHLMFTERMHIAGFTAERVRTRPITVAIDLVVTISLLIDGTLIAAGRAVIAVLVYGLAVGLTLTSMWLEPSTVAAAFPENPSR